MKRLTRQQAIGLCLLLLISGNEGVRVINQVSLNDAAQRLNENVASLQSHVKKAVAGLQANHSIQQHATWHTGWFANFAKSACPLDMALDGITKRYANKCEKLQKAAHDFKSSGLILGTGFGKVRELVMRAKGLQACMQADEVRPELKDLVEDPDSGVDAQLEKVYKTVISTVNESSITSWKPDPAIGCTMDLKLNRSLEPHHDLVKAFQKQFYGESCEVDAYKASQPAASRRILEILEEKLKKATAEAANGKSEEDIIQDLIEETEQSNNGDSSFLELNEEAMVGSLSGGIILLLCLLLIIFVFGYAMGDVDD